MHKTNNNKKNEYEKCIDYQRHTNLAASVANKTILETLNERLPEAEIVKLDELYPDFKIDVEAE